MLHPYTGIHRKWIHLCYAKMLNEMWDSASRRDASWIHQVTKHLRQDAVRVLIDTESSRPATGKRSLSQGSKGKQFTFGQQAENINRNTADYDRDQWCLVTRGWVKASTKIVLKLVKKMATRMHRPLKIIPFLLMEFEGSAMRCGSTFRDTSETSWPILCFKFFSQSTATRKEETELQLQL